MHEYKGIVNRVVDGDTIDLEIDLGFGIYTKIRVRLKDIDTPELFRAKTPMEKEQGRKAKRFVEKKILGKTVIVFTFKDKKGKYGRYVANILYNNGEGDCFLAEELKKAGFEKKRG